MTMKFKDWFVFMSVARLSDEVRSGPRGADMYLTAGAGDEDDSESEASLEVEGG